MLLVRLAGLLQVAFLPGYLIQRAFRARSNRALETMVDAFALSLLANYLLVVGLVAVGLYRPTVVHVVFAAECVAFAWLQRGVRPSVRLAHDAAEHLRAASGGYVLALAAAVVTVAMLAGKAIANWNAVFVEWDAVVSWNRWAVEWAGNAFPTTTWRYPQLQPVSWSMLYVFADDTTVQAFARILQAFYPLGIALVLLDVGLRQRSARFLLAVPLFVVLLAFQLKGSISSGYADVPVAFFGVLAVVTALYGDDDGTERRWWLALAFACAAAVTKQAGLVPLAFVWVVALRAVRRRGFAIGSGTLVLALVGSWYGFKEAQIRIGQESSELPGVLVTAHKGADLVDRLERAVRFTTSGGSALGIAGAIVAAVLIALSLRDRKQRWIVLAIVLPYWLLWAIAYSYDFRNATLIVPFIALAVAHGLPSVPALRPTVLQLTAGAIALVGAVGFASYSEDGLRERQLAEQQMIGDARLNSALYAYFGANPIRGKIGTGYQYLGFLPGFHGRMVVFPLLSVTTLDEIDRNPEVAYVMTTPEWSSAEAWFAIEQRIRHGQYRWIFDQPSSFGLARLVAVRPRTVR
jgi:hypothetical protein